MQPLVTPALAMASTSSWMLLPARYIGELMVGQDHAGRNGEKCGRRGRAARVDRPSRGYRFVKHGGLLLGSEARPSIRPRRCHPVALRGRPLGRDNYASDPTDGNEDRSTSASTRAPGWRFAAARSGGQLDDAHLDDPVRGADPLEDRVRDWIVDGRRTSSPSPCSERRDSSSDEMLMPASARIVPTRPTMPGRSWWRVTSIMPGQLGVDREAVEAGEVRAAVGGRAGQRQHRLPVGRADRQLDERRPRLRGGGPRLAHREPALVGDEVRVHRVHALIGDRLEDARPSPRCGSARTRRPRSRPRTSAKARRTRPAPAGGRGSPGAGRARRTAAASAASRAPPTAR